MTQYTEEIEKISKEFGRDLTQQEIINLLLTRHSQFLVDATNAKDKEPIIKKVYEIIVHPTMGRGYDEDKLHLRPYYTNAVKIVEFFASKQEPSEKPLTFEEFKEKHCNCVRGKTLPDSINDEYKLKYEGYLIGFNSRIQDEPNLMREMLEYAHDTIILLSESKPIKDLDERIAYFRSCISSCKPKDKSKSV